MLTQNKRLTIILTSVMLLLCIPLAAMQFTDEVKWTFFDFMTGGALLFGSGFLLELILRKADTTKKKIMYGLLLAIVLLLTWLELSVGIFGTPFAGQ